MIHNIMNSKSTKLFIILGGFFIANALIAEVIGVKIFSFEQTFGFQPLHIRFFGEDLSLNLTAGVLLWPVVFIMTDIINEYYGMKGVRFLSYLAAALITYAFIMFYGAMHVAPADFWITSKQADGIDNMQTAFSGIFGQGMWIILGSITAFLVSQLIDVTVFHKIKKMTGEKWVWLRATGSTVVSQLVDSFIVLFIAFKIGNGWTWQLVLAICLVNYAYKFTMAIVLTPLIYIIEKQIDNYLGHDTAQKMKRAAMGIENE